MRTNIVLDDQLLEEARRHSRAKTKRALVEEALRFFVAAKSLDERRKSYAERVGALERKLRGLKLRQRPGDLLRQDRDRS
jgi:Arc/MetJ family transcription regulator